MSSTKWKEVSLGDVLRQSEERITLDDSTTYKQITVSLWGRDVRLRQEILGVNIKTKTQYVARAGQFIYSRIDARNGAMGLVPPELDGAIVTSDFPVFNINNDKVDSRFFNLFFARRKFFEMCERASRGVTNRRRLKEDQLLSLNITIPKSVDEQRRIVTRIDAVTSIIKKAKEFRQEAAKELSSLMQVARRKFFGETPAGDWVQLSNYVESIENGWSPTCESRPASNDEWGVVKVGCVTSGSYNPRENKALPSHLQPVPRYEIQTGDFLMSRANTSELVGACAVVEETPLKLMLSDKIFRFIFRDTNQIDPRYLNHVLKSPSLRKQIERAATGTSPTMKNISKGKVLRLLIPKHDLTEQQRICAYLDDLQGKVSVIRRVQDDSSVELNAISSSILDKAFKGNL